MAEITDKDREAALDAWQATWRTERPTPMLIPIMLATARAEGRVAGLEEAAKECDAAHAKWCENCDRTDIEHSGPSYAAAVAGAAATRDCAAAIRALKEKA